MFLGGGVATVEAVYGPVDAGQAVGVNPGFEGGSAPTDADELGPEGPGGMAGGLTSFELSGHPTHVTQSRATIYLRASADGNNPASNSAPDFGQAIGVTDDRVEGCDVVSPQFEFTIEKHRTALFLPYVRTLTDLCGAVNAGPFWGWDAEEVLYLGASGRYSGDGGTAPTRWTITHKFAAGRKETDVEVGGGLVYPTKGPFDYAWVKYQEAKDVGAAAVLLVPQYAYLERVYRAADFAALEVGV